MPDRLTRHARSTRPVTARSGAVLLLVLMVLSGLALLALGLCHRARLDLRMLRMRGEQLQSYYLALGGIHRATAALRYDFAQRQADAVHFGQPWRLNTTAAAEGFFQAADEPWRSQCTLSYVTADEEGRLHLAHSSPAGWPSLPGLTEDLVDVILDWEDQDDAPRLRGAESDDYARSPTPCHAKNGPIEMVWELYLLMGLRSSDVAGEDANGNSLLDAGENDGAARWPVDNANGLLEPGLVDFFTVYGDGKVNLNTATPQVLAALPGLPSQAVGELIDYRNGSDGQPFTADDRAFESLDDLQHVSTLSPQTLQLLGQYGSVSAAHFRVISEAAVRPGARMCRLCGTLRRTADDVQLVLLVSQ